MEQSTPPTKYLKDYAPTAYTIATADLDVALDPAATRVTARLEMVPNPKAGDLSGSLRLDGIGIALEHIRIDGRPLDGDAYEVDATGLTLNNLPKSPFLLETVVTCNPEANTALSGLYRSQGIYCTQCEPEGFRRITYFLDRPDVLVTFRVRLEADRAEVPVLLSNGNLVAEGDLDGGRHFAVWEDPHRKPSYLFAMVGGKLGHVSDTFTTMSGREVALNIYVEPGKEDRCDWAMDSLKRAMAWDEERFGREYDLDVFNIVAVSDFNMGAMENKGLNVFNDKLILARPDTATDSDYASIEGVIAHEYFHNWSGNRVTCRDWFQLCLKEGLTVFRDQEYTADVRSAAVKRIMDVRVLKSHQFPEDAGPLAHPVRPDSYMEINNFYTATVYEKGAELCRMIQTIVGKDQFRKGLDLYFERHDGEAATVEDFVSAMEDATGAELAHFMDWYSQGGTPEVACSFSWDQSKQHATLTCTQSTAPTPGQSQKTPLHIPISMGLIGQNGDEIMLVRDDTGAEVEDGLVNLREREQTFTFRNVPSKAVPSLLRGFSAPVRLTTNLSTNDLAFLMANDSDPFNRWQSAQTFATQVMVDDVRGQTTPEQTKAAGTALAKAIGATLAEPALEPAYLAEFLRERIRALIGREIAGALEDAYDGSETPGPYSPEAGPAGKRSLRNQALALLAATGDRAHIDTLLAHYRNAQNMTDAMGALIVLTHIDIPERTEVFNDFYQRWQDEHLVVDKWFALQAISSLPGTLDTVRDLRKHPKFSMKTPNKVRALVSAFANQNPVNFNRADGAGYDWIADCVIEINAFNPQVAARVMGAFKSWRMLEPGRQAHATAALKRVVNTPELSRDVYEIVSKTLGSDAD